MTERPHNERRKADKAEHASRISQVVRMVLQCKPRAEILPHIAKEWGISERTARWYMALARREVQKEFNRRDQISLTWHLKARQNLIDYSMQANEPRVALAAMQDIAKLQGLYVEKVEHSTLDDTSIIFKVKAKPENA